MKQKYLSIVILTSMALYAKKPINLDVAKATVEHYLASGKWNRELEKVASKAWKKLKKIPVKQNSAIVFDIDDTLISSHEANKKIGYGNLLVCNPAWADQADFPAIKPMKDLYDKLLHKGFKIFLLSNRAHTLFEPTKKNLREQGYTNYERIIIREPNVPKISSGLFKEQAREKLVNQGYEIIATIGDQESDIAGNYTGIKVKIPNYLYQVK